MRKSINFILVLVVILMGIQEISYSQSVWSTRYIGNIGGNYLRRVQFVNSLTGYSGGGNGIFVKTTDGGDTWNTINIGASNFISSIFFVNQSTGYVGSTAFNIKKTTDGGNSWTTQPIAATNYTADLYFINDQTGFAAGHGGQIFKTVNGGTNWVNIAPTSIAWGEVQFLNENTGWILSDMDLYKTTNGGLNWTSILHNSASQLGYFQDYCFVDQLTGYVTIPSGIAKTINGGESWSFKTIPISTPMAIKFLNNNVGWCVGYSGSNAIITATANGGTNWVTQATELNNIYYDISFINTNSGWATGNSIISFTGNGGLVSVSTVSTNVPVAYSLQQNYPNPFNPTTKISFDIKNSTFASLKVYDMTGKEVKILVNENIAAGSYEISFNASEFNSGVYFYTLKTNDFTETKKMMLVK